MDNFIYIHEYNLYVYSYHVCVVFYRRCYSQYRLTENFAPALNKPSFQLVKVYPIIFYLVYN